MTTTGTMSSSTQTFSDAHLPTRKRIALRRLLIVAHLHSTVSMLNQSNAPRLQPWNSAAMFFLLAYPGPHMNPRVVTTQQG
eukprot:3808368-Rhodomonas_salina.1